MNERLEKAVLDAMLQAGKRQHDLHPERIPVLISTLVPRELVQAYLQMLRTYDVEHDMDSAIGVLGGIDKATLLEIFGSIVPPFPFMEERQV